MPPAVTQHGGFGRSVELPKVTLERRYSVKGFQRDTNAVDGEKHPSQQNTTTRDAPRVRNVPIKLIKKGGQQGEPPPPPDPTFTEITFNRTTDMCKTPGVRKVARDEDGDDKSTSRRVPIVVKHEIRMPRSFEKEKDVFSWDCDFEKELSAPRYTPRSTDSDSMWGDGKTSLRELLKSCSYEGTLGGRHHRAGSSSTASSSNVIDSDIEEVGDEMFCWERERCDVLRAHGHNHENGEDRLSRKLKSVSVGNREISSEVGMSSHEGRSGLSGKARERKSKPASDERVDCAKPTTGRLPDSRLDAIVTEIQLQDRSLAKEGACRYPIAGDGNCLYRAVAHALYGNQGLHTDLRRRTVQYMRDHRDDFAPFLDCDADPYFAKAGEDGEWAGYTEMVALMRLLNVDVKLTTGGTSGQPDVTSGVHRVREEGDSGCNKTVWLSWLSHGHYDAVER
ncbi:OTU domain-containing protein 1 [Branchiostoma belcheri]|nr:OTU domain-containing protein 1 [Branchiostoma belcheri]